MSSCTEGPEGPPDEVSVSVGRGRRCTQSLTESCRRRNLTWLEFGRGEHILMFAVLQKENVALAKLKAESSFFAEILRGLLPAQARFSAGLESSGAVSSLHPLPPNGSEPPPH